MQTNYIKCQKVTYEALGQTHLINAPEKFSYNEINFMIKSIIDTSLIISVENDEVNEQDYESLNIDKLKDWLDDLTRFDERTGSENT